MITADTVKKLSTKYQTQPLNVWREYMQHLFLSYYYQHPDSKKVYFKGGTALRIVYKSPRFSEDLDFSTEIHDKEKHHELLLKAVEATRFEGITSVIEEAKETSGGYLAITKFTLPGFPEPVNLKLEASYRGKELKGELQQISSDFIPPYPVSVLDKDQLIDEKIAALLDRQKPRDFYDLYYLLRSGYITTEQKALLSKALPVVEKTKINFKGELGIFLPVSAHPIIKDFKTTLEREIRRYV
jgi:predicted nucleotidyltransferase component of viral defense system